MPLDPHGHEDLRPGAVRLYEQGHISYEDALRNSDSKNELRLRVKLESKRENKPVEADGDLSIAEEVRRQEFLGRAWQQIHSR